MVRLIELNREKSTALGHQNVKKDSLLKRIGSIVSHLNHYKSTTGLVPILTQPAPHIHGNKLVL